MPTIFNSEMANFLANRVNEESDQLFPPNNEARYAAKSKTAWANLTSDINGKFGCNVSTEQVKEKYKNLKKSAKRKKTDEDKYESFLFYGNIFCSGK